jgi:hypothetical protein
MNVVELKAEEERIASNDLCFVCRRPLGENAGQFFSDYGLRVHRVACSEVVMETMRTRDRSDRGRWVTPREMKLLLSDRWQE